MQEWFDDIYSRYKRIVRRSDATVICSQLTMAAVAESDTVIATLSTEKDQIATSGPELEIGFRVPDKRWTGDLDKMESERLIRVLTVYGLGRYFIDGGRERGSPLNCSGRLKTTSMTGWARNIFGFTWYSSRCRVMNCYPA